MTKNSERLQARQLRQEGCTYPEIARRLRVSKSSVSLWCEDMQRGTPADSGEKPA